MALNIGRTTDMQQLAGKLADTAAVVDQMSARTNATTNTNITTVGNGTLTAAALTSRVITRSGSTGAYTDTTDTAANTIAALTNATVGQSWILYIVNTVAFAQTLSAGTGVTLSGTTIIPPLSVGEFVVAYSGTGAVTMQGVETVPIANLPAAQYSTAALQSAQMTGAQVAGANIVVFDNTGTTPGNLQMPTAANLIAAIPNAQIGMSYELRIRNDSGSANTATITTATGITLTGTMTIAQNVTRYFIVTITGAAAVTVQSIGTSAAGT